MKNSVKQKNDQMERKGSWKHKVEPCKDLDRYPWLHSWKRLEPREKDKMKQMKPRIWRASGIKNWIYSMKQEKELYYAYPSPIKIDDKQRIWHTTYSRIKD